MLIKSKFEIRRTREQSESNVRPAGRKRLVTPWACAILAAFGIFGGISSLFIGIVCVALHSLIAQDQVFDHVGTFLLIAAIPMILIGSIFLDEINQKDI